MIKVLNSGTAFLKNDDINLECMMMPIHVHSEKPSIVLIESDDLTAVESIKWQAMKMIRGKLNAFWSRETMDYDVLGVESITNKGVLKKIRLSVENGDGDCYVSSFPFGFYGSRHKELIELLGENVISKAIVVILSLNSESSTDGRTAVDVRHLRLEQKESLRTISDEDFNRISKALPGEFQRMLRKRAEELNLSAEQIDGFKIGINEMRQALSQAAWGVTYQNAKATKKIN